MFLLIRQVNNKKGERKRRISKKKKNRMKKKLLVWRMWADKQDKHYACNLKLGKTWNKSENVKKRLANGIAKVSRRPEGDVDMHGRCLCLIVCPICLALSLQPLWPHHLLLLLHLCFPPPESAHTLHCAVVSPSPLAGRRPGSFHPQQLVALFTCTVHICTQLPTSLQCAPSCRIWASAGTRDVNQKHSDACKKAD